jgi:hypothetical protein
MKKLILMALCLTLLPACSLTEKASSLFSTSPELQEYSENGSTELKPEINQAIDLIQEKADFEKEVAETKEKANEGETLIQITYPEAAKVFRTSDLRVVLWGEIYNPENVAFVQVNDYMLTKYETGQKEFNYIATSKAGTLKRGENTYLVKALNSEKEVISETTYKIISDAKYQRLTHSGPETFILLAALTAFAIASLRIKRA